MTVATLVLLVLFVGLGRWQWERGDAKAGLWQAFERGMDSARPLGASATRKLERFQHVSVSGVLDAQRQFLLDNRTLDGRAGYEVLTPLRLEDGRVLLVNRGWIAFSGFREQLPVVALSRPDAAPVTVSGRLDELPSAGISIGRAAPALTGSWPRVTTFPGVEELAAALEVQQLEPRVLLLDPDQPEGYIRKWRPPGMEPARHWSYAVQWWSFAGVLLILFVALNLRRTT